MSRGFRHSKNERHSLAGRHSPLDGLLPSTQVCGVAGRNSAALAAPDGSAASGAAPDWLRLRASPGVSFQGSRCCRCVGCQGARRACRPPRLHARSAQDSGQGHRTYAIAPVLANSSIRLPAAAAGEVAPRLQPAPVRPTTQPLRTRGATPLAAARLSIPLTPFPSAARR